MKKRKWVQLISAVLYNCHFTGFMTGRIDQGPQKGLCVPGLNCWSCPGAAASCPLGALQSGLVQSRFRFPYYVLGVLLLFGAALGRVVCGFLCPFGWLQELLHRIPTPKLRKSRVTRAASWLKYAVLALTVVLPVLLREPIFCKYICPAGTLEAGIPLIIANERLRALAGALFTWKTALLAACIAGVVLAYRGFCRFVCPLGAFYSLFNRMALVGMRVDAGKCTHCDRCVRACQMDIRQVGDRECIACGKCMSECPEKAISFGVRGAQLRVSPNADAQKKQTNG